VRFQEAKKRLRNYVINTDMKSDQAELKRLIAYFQHRPHTFITIMKGCFEARRANRGISRKNDAHGLEY